MQAVDVGPHGPRRRVPLDADVSVAAVVAAILAALVAVRAAPVRLHQGRHRQPGVPGVAAGLGRLASGVRGHVARRLRRGRRAAGLQRQPAAAAAAHVQLPRAASPGPHPAAGLLAAGEALQPPVGGRPLPPAHLLHHQQGWRRQLRRLHHQPALPLQHQRQLDGQQGVGAEWRAVAVRGLVLRLVLQQRVLGHGQPGGADQQVPRRAAGRVGRGQDGARVAVHDLRVHPHVRRLIGRRVRGEVGVRVHGGRGVRDGVHRPPGVRDVGGELAVHVRAARVRRGLQHHGQGVVPDGRGHPQLPVARALHAGEERHPRGQQGGPRPLQGHLYQRRQGAGRLPGLQVHRDLVRHPAQRGRAAGGRAEADPAAGDARPEAPAPRLGVQPAARLAHLPLAQHRARDPAQDLPQRLQVQVVREPARALRFTARRRRRPRRRGPRRPPGRPRGRLRRGVRLTTAPGRGATARPARGCGGHRGHLGVNHHRPPAAPGPAPPRLHGPSGALEPLESLESLEPDSRTHAPRLTRGRG